MKQLVVVTLTSFTLGLALGEVAAQPSAPTTEPVIVVFREDAPFQNFREQHRPDERGRANPPAWDYLDPGVVGAVQALEARQGFRAEHVYSAALRGFSARLTTSQIEALSRNPMVASIEADVPMTVIGAPGAGGGQTLPWGIDAIDADISSARAGDGGGEVGGVTAYVIDTGIDAAHTDLNVVAHVNFAGDGNNADCNGHGTHVAGTIAARDNRGDVVGAAPGVRLVGVKVLGCNGSGSASAVAKGVDWVTRNAARPAIANVSLGGPATNTLDRSVERSASAGIFYSIAAGNNGLDACNVSPARTGTRDGIMTVAAFDSAFLEPVWSNFGACVDVWAPGVSILSTRMGGGTRTLSGTSMAAPHVGGTGALYLSTRPESGAAAVETALKGDALSTGTVSRDGRAILRIYAAGY
jgi:subtilisin family serine protease